MIHDAVMNDRFENSHGMESRDGGVRLMPVFKVALIENEFDCANAGSADVFVVG